jgi:hypothetical protein
MEKSESQKLTHFICFSFARTCDSFLDQSTAPLNLAPTRQASGIHAWTSKRAGHVTSLGANPLPDPTGGHRTAHFWRGPNFRP